MDFTFSEEQTMVAQVVGELLAAECSMAQLRKQMDAGLAFDTARWAKLCEMGLPGILIAEECGGLGLSATDFILVAEACGYAALPEPLVEMAGIALPALAALRENARVADLLTRALTGEAIVAVGHAQNPYVLDADQAEAVLLFEADKTYLVPRKNLRLTRKESIDPLRRLFAADYTPSSSDLVAEGDVARDLAAQALDRGALFAAAQMVGLGQRAIHIATDYAKERKQFGKPIGANQAIKHLAATAQVKVEFARPVLYAAAGQIDQFDLFARARISHAKLAAGDAADLAVRSAIQIHGAMGYSWEVDVHFLLKRSLGLSQYWGTPKFHRSRVDARIFNAPVGADHIFTKENFHG